MDFNFSKAKWSEDSDGVWLMILAKDGDMIKRFVQTLEDKLYSLVIKLYKPKRSLDANGAMWQVLSMMAGKLNTTKDDLYLEMLDRYGIFTHIVVKPNAVEKFKKEWRLVRNLGEVTVNGQTGIQLQCYFGSSLYNSSEFSTLLSGIIQDAKEIGVDFISREDQARMIQEWGKKDVGNKVD